MIRARRAIRAIRTRVLVKHVLLIARTSAGRVLRIISRGSSAGVISRGHQQGSSAGVISGGHQQGSSAGIISRGHQFTCEHEREPPPSLVHLLCELIEHSLSSLVRRLELWKGKGKGRGALVEHLHAWFELMASSAMKHR